MIDPIILVAGARPNFIKLAPVVHSLRESGRIPFRIVHTGQHYDGAMSARFFEVLGIPDPDANLEVGSGSHAVQTARVLERFEAVLTSGPAAAVVVFGDVNSTLACGLAASKLNVPLAHVEAGLRSFDRTMPEEINRLLVDAISDLLLVSEPAGLENLRSEGIGAAVSVRHVGNVMIDSLERVRSSINVPEILERYSVSMGEYGLLTLHRPANVDDPASLQNLLACFEEIALDLPVVFPAHPRTRAAMACLGRTGSERLRVIEPVGYIDSIALQAGARVVFTDSGGMQEESSCLRVPCITLRPVTERPITVELGTSTLVGNDRQKIMAAYERVSRGTYKQGVEIPLWDGRAAHRIVAALEEWLGVAE